MKKIKYLLKVYLLGITVSMAKSNYINIKKPYNLIKT